MRASIPNPDGALLPGMYRERVAVDAGQPRPLVTIPLAAVAFNPYGSLVYVLHDEKDAQGKEQQVVRQQFVTTGASRGDQVSILKGVGAERRRRHRRAVEVAQRIGGENRQRGAADRQPDPRAAGLLAMTDRPPLGIRHTCHALQLAAAMKFTDIFIRRPVLACVVSLMLLVVGLKAFYALPSWNIRRPRTRSSPSPRSITAPTPRPWPASSPRPWRMPSPRPTASTTCRRTAAPAVSTITANLVLNFDPDKAITEITAKINSVLNQLPAGVQQPTLSVAIGQSLDALIIGFSSDDLSPNQITDYLVRNVQPRLQAVPGVQTAELLGGQNFAMRAWLDPAKLAAYGLSATDVNTALAANNVIAGIGTTKGQMVQFNLTASTTLHSAQQFRNLVIKQVNGGIIRLGDVANVTLGSDDYESSVEYNGKKGVYIGIQTVPSASLLDGGQRRESGAAVDQAAASRRPVRRRHLRLHRVREQRHP